MYAVDRLRGGRGITHRFRDRPNSDIDKQSKPIGQIRVERTLIPENDSVQ